MPGKTVSSSWLSEKWAKLGPAKPLALRCSRGQAQLWKKLTSWVWLDDNPNKWDTEHALPAPPNGLDRNNGSKALLQITRSYAMLGYIDKKLHQKQIRCQYRAQSKVVLWDIPQLPMLWHSWSFWMFPRAHGIQPEGIQGVQLMHNTKLFKGALAAASPSFSRRSCASRRTPKLCNTFVWVQPHPEVRKGNHQAQEALMPKATSSCKGWAESELEFSIPSRLPQLCY